MERIKLSYDESKISTKISIHKEIDKDTQIELVKTKTTVTVPCYFKHTQLEAKFAEFGFKTLPEGVINILNNYGFHREEKGWYCEVSGSTIHVVRNITEDMSYEEDEYSEKRGYETALCLAKSKIQSKGAMIMYELKGVFDTMSCVFEDSFEILYDASLCEYDRYYKWCQYGDGSID